MDKNTADKGEFPVLADLLDDSFVSLRRFKDKLDRLDDAPRDAAFALWPEHPNFETLIDELGKWAERLRTAEEVEVDPYSFATLDDLTEQYQAFMARENLELGSADEHVDDESLTEEQRAWVAGFSQRWDIAERWEHELCRQLKIEKTPERLKQYYIRFDGREYPLLGFVVANNDAPEVVTPLLAGNFGSPISVAVHAGYEEITLLGRILDESKDPEDPWWRCVCNNEPQDDGFIACDVKGEPQVDDGDSPLPEWDGKHYKCLTCGVYFGGKDDLAVRGPVGQRSP